MVSSRGVFGRAAVAALAIFGGWAGVALAGPPFVTDDPEPVEFKHWEFYVFGGFNQTEGGDAAQVPAVEVNYGLVPDVQLHLVAPATYSDPAGEPAHWGYGDTELGVKYRFIHETDSIPQVAFFPLVEVPTGDDERGLGNGKAQVFLPLWLQKSFGKDEKWTTFGGGGFWYNPGEGNRNFFRVGWALQREINDHWTLGAEVFHETPNVEGSSGHTAFNVGGYWNIDDHNHILFSVGRDISGPSRFLCYLGYQLTF